jgi:LacI family transcriptional regulator
MRRKRRKIAVLMWLSRAFAQRVLAGVLEQLQADPTIDVTLVGREMHRPAPVDVERINEGDGLINLLEAHELVGVLDEVKGPVVSAPLLGPVARGVNILPSYAHVTDLAAEHFGQSYLPRVTYCSAIPRDGGDPLVRAMAGSARSAGLEILPGRAMALSQRRSGRAKFDTWLRSLPKPVGIFCDKDGAASRLIEICGRLDLVVPEEVAVLGLGDNPLRCLRCRPTLSSIALPAEEFGRRAADRMVALLEGRPAEPVELPPLGVMQRGSTDLVAVDDPMVAGALRYLRDHAGSRITIDGMVAHLGLTRRSFQRRFRQVTGRTPIAELIRLRVQLAKQRLAQTDLPMFNIAIDCGFADQTAMGKHFRRHTGMSPTAYRARFRHQRGTSPQDR